MQTVMDRLLSQLGICKKAGKLVQGFDAVSDAAQNKTLHLIVTAKDFSPKSQKEIAYVAQQTHTALLAMPVGMADVERMMGRRYGVLGISDQGLAGSVAGLVCRANEEE